MFFKKTGNTIKVIVDLWPLIFTFLFAWWFNVMLIYILSFLFLFIQILLLFKKDEYVFTDKNIRMSSFVDRICKKFFVIDYDKIESVLLVYTLAGFIVTSALVLKYRKKSYAVSMQEYTLEELNKLVKFLEDKDIEVKDYRSQRSLRNVIDIERSKRIDSQRKKQEKEKKELDF